MLKKTLLLLTLGLTLSTDFLLTTVAATAIPANTIAQRFVPRRRSLLRFKVPNIRGSRNLESGAARGECSPQEISAVVPAKPVTMASTDLPVQLTLSDRPTFFVSVPQTSATQAAFLLQNETGDEILLEKTVPLNANKGIMSYTLPADFPGLKVGQKYSWRFSLLCDPTGGDRSGDPVTSGWIQRVQPTATVTQQLQTATNRQRVFIYADNGYWNDTLKTLADLRATNPSDLTLLRDWVDLFKSVGLDAIANQPIIQLSTATASQ
ncbi:DUF928 domain-containing protein [Nostoc sp. CENA67]|uniref:DUF928 domain-containing protein n=1 Tax=Amazonocrinis nigriterrae CENA67 TaxID=2794033 RepID=A0A8J7HV15_9NOST|nr:DUF928 domain-containing protein [Amazonocrinis nigriterrae]MBH8566321.1 DUF928 domain-containing protein [Amazonocrinis nigriterrae CENA67]